MAKTAGITLHPLFTAGDISSRLFGAFLEPIGTMVNGTMYNPKHSTADDKGFRGDFINAVKEANLPAVRLPGGNFVSGWDWKDSIGSRTERKTRLDPAWRQYITNEIGLDEYLLWAERACVEPLYTLNLGTGDINDAMKLIEYTNHPGGSYWSDLRRKNGHKAPYNIKTWYLGNEMDGPWQLGSRLFNPKEYGVICNEVSKAMKMIDPRIETIACASTSFTMPHYPQWDAEVLTHCYEAVDYVSLHYYHSAPPGDYAALLGGTRYIEDYIDTMIAVCDYVQAIYRSPKKLMLSFDEYGTIPREPEPLNYGRGLHGFLSPHYTFDKQAVYVKHDPDNMPEHSFPGDDMLFALTSASAMLAFLRRADRVKIGCMTGGLHAAAAANRSHVWRCAAYYPLTHLITYGRGVSLRTDVCSDTFDIPGYAMSDTALFYTQKNVPYIDAAAAYDKEGETLTVFAINRSPSEEYNIEIDINAFNGYTLVEHIELFSENPEANNTYDNPDMIIPFVNSASRFKNGTTSARFKKLSWNVIRFKKKDK